MILTQLLCVCGLQVAYPQTQGDAVSMSFEVKDTTTLEPLVGVTCRVYTSSDKFYTYAISDKNGIVKLSPHQSDWLEFTFMGYEKQKVRVNHYHLKQANIVYMKPSSVTLKEVQIKAPPISARNDTLVYRVGAFAKIGDKHLEDVLKRLPGVKVSENGTVSVQGKAINKFYIEGMDLMGNNYNQVTQNMPIDAVTSVEVLENHQPVKMLQGKQLSDKAALNIKIDKSHKSRPFGELEGGLGLSPTRWDNRAFVTHIANKSQLLLSGKMNNTGNDLSEETTEHIDVTDLEAFEPITSPLLTTDLVQEQLPQNRYLYNKSYAGGVNFLRKLSDNSTLRFNTQLYEDHSSRNNSIEYIFGGFHPLSLREDASMKKKDFTIVPILKYELNSANTFVSDELRVSVSKKSAITAILSNESSINETVKTHPSYIQNYFSSSFPVGNTILQAKSLIRYFDRTESLNDISDSTIIYNCSNRYAFKSFVAKGTLSTKFLLFRNYLDLGVKAYYHDNSYDYNGNTHHQDLNVIFSPSYYVKYGKRSGLTIALPIGWMYARLLPVNESIKNRGFFSLSPEISFNHAFSDEFSLGFSASIGNSNDTKPFYSPDFLRIGYRTVYLYDSNLYKNTDYLLSLRLKYRNLASMFFSNLSVSYSNGKRESYFHYDYTDSLNIIRQIQGENDYKTFIINGMADKTFVDVGISLKTEISYNQSGYLLSQSTEHIYNRSHVLSGMVSTTFQKFKWMRLVLDATGTLFWERNSYHDSETMSSLNANASFYFFPFKGFEIKMKCQDITNKIAESQYESQMFFDASMNYKISKIGEIGLSGTNLLNTNSYLVIQNSGLNSCGSFLPLRGREVLLRLLLRI